MTRNWGLVIGAAQLALGRAAGIARFGNTSMAFLASLAPLIAFPLVGAALASVRVGPVQAATMLLLTVVAQLAPAVLSNVLAERWDRGSNWLRYATAFNWCQWTIPVVVVLFSLMLELAEAGGLSEGAANTLLVLGLAAFGIFLHWVIARHGLALQAGRALLLVVLVNSGTAALVLGPAWLARAAAPTSAPSGSAVAPG